MFLDSLLTSTREVKKEAQPMNVIATTPTNSKRKATQGTLVNFWSK